MQTEASQEYVEKNIMPTMRRYIRRVKRAAAGA